MFLVCEAFGEDTQITFDTGIVSIQPHNQYTSIHLYPLDEMVRSTIIDWD